MATEPAAKPFRYDRSLIEGPIVPAVWKLAWPTMLQNVIAGLQGVIDQAMVGNFVGSKGNAALGDSWQIILIVVVFLSSMFTGMGVLVARFAGANQPERVNRVVYQAFLTAFGLSVLLAAYLNEDKLTEDQMTGIRYFSLVSIYVSSTADIFIN